MKNRCLTLFVMLAALLCSCTGNLGPEAQKVVEAKKFIHSQMKIYYYWYTEVPSKADYSAAGEVEDFFNGLLVPKDRWSWMETGEEYAADVQGTVYGSYGASLGQPLEYYRDYDVKVRYVIPGSPFGKAGVTRGWTITHIDGVSKDELVNSGKFSDIFYNPPTTTPRTFTFLDLEGQVRELQITAAAVINMRPALISEIYGPEDYPGLSEKVAYFHYLGFQAGKDMNGKAMMDDIKDNMKVFRAAGVKKLILDLRYNGGGDSRASDTLINYLAPASSVGQVYVKRTHNAKLQNYDQEYEITRISDAAAGNYSLDLDRLYVITGSGTASASEMLLNGLKPLMNVEQVGDTTYGKPNGMYVLLYPDTDDDMKKYDSGNYSSLEYAFLPICFYNCNGLGENIPDNGLKPGRGYRPDDLYHDFGPQEDNISACLYHIVNGSYPALPPGKGAIPASQVKSSAPMRNAKLEEEVRNPNYGKFFGELRSNF